MLCDWSIHTVTDTYFMFPLCNNNTTWCVCAQFQIFSYHFRVYLPLLNYYHSQREFHHVLQCDGKYGVTRSAVCLFVLFSLHRQNLFVWCVAFFICRVKKNSAFFFMRLFITFHIFASFFTSIDIKFISLKKLYAIKLFDLKVEISVDHFFTPWNWFCSNKFRKYLYIPIFMRI